MDFEFNFDGIAEEASKFNVVNGVNYLKRNHNLEENQAFFITHLEIREFTGTNGTGGREISKLLDSVKREKGLLNVSKVEKRVRHTNEKHNKNWFIVEVGMIIDLVD